MKTSQKQKNISFLAFLIAFWAFGSFTCQANEANLKAGVLGPNISVGFRDYSRTYLKENSFEISANKKFNVKDLDGKIIQTVPANTDFEIRYDDDGDKYFQIYKSEPKIKIYKQITFDAADKNNINLIFDIDIDSDLTNYFFDKYRGKIRLRYVEKELLNQVGIETDYDRIWAINILPLEQYVWGMGEITGTGDMNYNRTMTVSYRTYGYWKRKFSKLILIGFRVNATPGNQLYYGYEWEKNHLLIKQAAKDTQGEIVMYGDKIALTPYFSWSDGKTRRYEDGHWNRTCDTNIGGTISKIYPWMSSVKDPYGKHPNKSTCTLAKEGNHMVGLSANGALKLADKYDWGWERILKYYYTGVKIAQVYPQ